MKKFISMLFAMALFASSFACEKDDDHDDHDDHDHSHATLVVNENSNVA
tara:strand:- start:3545 stop:3691 length:147 start_codon:yes stop_codon:yes gene_type:complete